MNTLVNRMLDLAIEIQQIPAPTFDEGIRGDFVRARFVDEGLASVSKDSLGNVYGCLSGEADAPPLVICAHLDTVFPIEKDLRVKRYSERIAGAGIGDNSLGVAGMFGLLWTLREQNIRLAGDVWLVGTVGEEGLGNLNGMRAVVERFGATPQAYLVLEGMALGHIYHRGLGVQRYKICAHTAGGHSWGNYGSLSAIHELAALVHQLNDLKLPEKPRTSLNVGVISGGTSINTIAADACMELDLRSESAETLAELVRDVENLVETANKPKVTVEAQVIGRRPAGEITASHPLVKLAEDCLRQQKIEPALVVGSTDANIPLSLGFPSVCIGLTTGGGAHTMDEFINTRPVPQGLAQLVDFVTRVWK